MALNDVTLRINVQDEAVQSSLTRIQSGLNALDQTAAKSTTQAGRAAEGLKRVAESAARNTGADLSRVRGEVYSISSALQTMQSLWIGVQAAQAAFASFQGLTQRADEYANLSGRLKLVTNGSKEYAIAQGEIFRIAQQTQAPLVETGALYARMAQSMTALGKSQAETVAVTEAVALGLRISGASATESGSAMLQLSQALASGVLRGEEFNAMSEASPRLMTVLADSLGVTRGALRQMAEEGRLTAEVVSGALAKSVEQLRTEAAALPQTVGGAITQLNNAFTQFLGTSEEVSGSTAVLVGLLKQVGNYLPEIATATVLAGFAALAVAIGKVGAALGAMTAAGGALAFLGGPLGILLALAAAASGAIYYFTKETETSFERQARAQAEGKVATEAVTEAQKRQNEELKRAGEALADMEKRYQKIQQAAQGRPGDTEAQERLAQETKVMEQARANYAQMQKEATAAYAELKANESQLEEAIKKRAELQMGLAKKTAEVQKKASKEALEAQIADQNALAEVMKKNQADQLERAKKLQEESKKLKDEAQGLRESASGRREANELNQIEDPEEKQSVIGNRLRDQLAEAEKLADWALSEKYAGRTDSAGKLAEQAEKAAKAAERYANMLDSADAKNEGLAQAEEQQARAKDAQAEQKKAEADQALEAAKSFGQVLEEATAKLNALKEEAKQLALGMDNTEAMNKLAEVEAKISELQNKNIQLGGKGGQGSDPVSPAPDPFDSAQGRATGGRLVGPGTPTSDSIPLWGSRDEFMVKAASSKAVGYDVLNYINQYGKLPDWDKWPKYAAGGRIGEAVQRVNAQMSGVRQSAREAAQTVQASFNFPGVGQFPATVSKAVADELGRVLSMEALKRGRR